MALQKQNLNVAFMDLDTKTDPWQIDFGKFLDLENIIFDTAKLFQKRNGFGLLTSLPNSSSTFLTTYNGNLTALGQNLYTFSTGANVWENKGQLRPVSVSVSTLVRTNTNQVQADSVIAANGLICTAYTETSTTGNVYKYVIADSATGQNVIAPTSFTATGSPKVFVLGNYFMVVFPNGTHLQYIAISTAAPSSASAATDISTQVTYASTCNFDGYVFNNRLYLAWNGNDGGGAVRMAYVTSGLTVSSAKVFSTFTANVMSVTVDSTGNTPVVWASWYGSDGRSAAVDQNLNTILSPTVIIPAATAVVNITSVGKNDAVQIFYETTGSYTYDANVPTNLVQSVICTTTGSVGDLATTRRGVGLRSKAVIYNNVNYVLLAYNSPYQSTYFLVDCDVGQSGNIDAKLAYSNGFGYCTTGLPSLNVNNSSLYCAYLIQDQVQAANKSQTATNNKPVYAQTGINLATFTIGSSQISTAEIATNLHISGGFLWHFDGFSPVEHNFHLWPDSVEATWTTTSTVTPTGTFSSGSTTVTVSSATGIVVGMTITDTSNATYIPTGTIITNVNGTTLTMSQATTHSGAGDNLSIQGNIHAQPDGSTNTKAYFYVATYEWSDNQGNVYRSAPSVPISVTTTGAGTAGSIRINVPTLRLTAKTTNPVKIVIYRWSVGQQTYYQVTQIATPLLNDLTVDSVAFVDPYADSAIIGNNILYTTGGVVEDIGAPATNLMTLYKARLFLVDAEDPNLIWFSKQVIESTPVEMSDLFTQYIAPTIGAQGNTGQISAISSMDDKLILFKKNAIYYMTGNGPDNTGANNDFSDPIFIVATVGCSNQNSIVFIPQGLMFQSDKGIWLLGRDLSTSYIGAPVEKYNSATVLSALTIPGTNQVRFVLNNGIVLMYDYFYNKWGTFTNISQISACLYNNLHTYLNSSGSVFQETPGIYLDNSSPVLMSFTTGWFNLTGLQGYQRAYFFYLLGSYITPHKLNVQVAYDYNPSFSQQDLIGPDNFSASWGSDNVWGANSSWGGSVTKEQWRVFLQQQRCQAFQIKVNEVYDSSLGVAAGAGLTLSGINLVFGQKKNYPTIESGHAVG